MKRTRSVFLFSTILMVGAPVLYTLACKPRKDASSALRSKSAAGVTSIGAHDLLPQRQREEALARADLLKSANKWNNTGTVVALADTAATKGQCSSPLEDVNCYWDACASELGGNIAANYLPEGIDPRKPETGETIKTFWNEKLIEWKQVDGVWQYTFDGKPGAKDWPEIGANLTAPVTSTSSLRCDFMQQSNISTCIPGQRRMEIDRNGVHWQMLFRRSGPIQPGVPDDSELSINKWGNIAIVVFRQTQSQMQIPGGKKTSANAVCWLNTFNKTNAGNIKNFPLPVPGGRFGSSPEELARRKLAIDFWDTPNEHRTLTAFFGGSISNEEGENCVTCHGNGPMLDAVWYREHRGVPSDDDRIPFYSVAGLHNPRTFWKVTGSCASCHGYWAQKSDTCLGLTSEYTTRSSDEKSSGLRLGQVAVKRGDQDALEAPPAEKMLAKHVMLMPDPGAEMTVGQYNAEFSAELDKIRNCCQGKCSEPTFTVLPPLYKGMQEPSIADQFFQYIPAPDEPVNLAVTRGSCQGTSCTYSVSWSDPQSKYSAAHRYVVAAGPVGTLDFCRQPLAEAAVFPNPTNRGWGGSYSTSVTATCGEEIRVCGINASTAKISVSQGVGAPGTCM